MSRGSRIATQTRSNTRNLALWTFMWLITLALASFGPKFFWNGTVLMTVFVVILNAGFGIGMILANRRFINGLDELQKKIQLESMAIALGVAVVGGLSYSLLDVTNLIPGDAEISLICILISLSYLGGIWFGQKRYA